MSLDPLDAGEQPGSTKADLLRAWADDLGVKIYSIRDVEALGRAAGRPVSPPRPDDVVTINYTSGTTGNPKGVVLTHANAVAAASCGLATAPQDSSSSVNCSYLPLAHIFERVCQHSSLWAGAAIGFFHGNIVELVDDLKLLRPTAFISVPRLYNRFGGVIRAATVEQDGFKGAMSRHIVSTKLENLKGPKGTSHARAVRPHLGPQGHGRLWPRPHEHHDLGLGPAGPEPAPVPADRVRQQVPAGLRPDRDVRRGHGAGAERPTLPATAAPSLAAVEACLMDVPDMDYLTTDKPQPRGELLLRGNTLFREYFRSEAETKKAMLDDGWFRTGDICTVDDLGRFTIVDRVKNVLKLAQGEYISPERIENVYLSNCSWMAQAYVHGDSMQTFLVAIFGVQPDVFAPWAGKILRTRIAPDDRAALHAAAQDPRVRKAVIKELDHVGKRNKFNSYERVRNCYLFVEPFTVENELLTPTYVFYPLKECRVYHADQRGRLKLKRPQTAKKHRADLDTLYEEALAEEKGRAKL